MAQTTEQIIAEQAKQIKQLQRVVHELERRLRNNERLTTNVKENLRTTRNGLHELARRIR